MKKLTEKTEVKKENLNMKSAVFYIPLALLALVLVASLFAYIKYGSVAAVNGRQVSRLEYIKNMEKQGGKQVLEGMIEESLIMGEASKKGVTIEQGVIDSEITKIDDQLKTQGQTLDAALTAQSMTKNDLIQQIKLQKTVEKLANSPTEVTQAQIDDFLAKNKDQFPKTATKEEMTTTAKTQLLSQLRSEAISKWFEELKKAATIIYK
jgi:hypothetical protein